MPLTNDLDFYVGTGVIQTQPSDAGFDFSVAGRMKVQHRCQPGLIAGINRDISSAGNENIWDGPQPWVPPTAARIHDIASDNANDTLLGTGARKIQILGLDDMFAPQQEIADMDGMNDVATANTYTRINDMFVIEAGTDDVNQGIITATAQTDGTVTALMPAGTSETQAAVYSVGAERLLLITKIEIQMFLDMGNPNANVSTAIRTRRLIDSPDAALRTSIPIRLNRDVNPLFSRNSNVYVPIPEKTDIVGHVLTSSANNVEVAMAIEFLLIDLSE